MGIIDELASIFKISPSNFTHYMYRVYPFSLSLSLLHRGQMFVFSKDHLRSLFSSSFSHCPTLLDIGAGDGAVTAILEQILSPSAVHVTETSPVMQRRLTSHGYQ